MKVLILCIVCALLTACGDTVYQESPNSKASVNSVVVTDGTINSSVISVTEKEFTGGYPGDNSHISFYVESSLTNTSDSDAYTIATVSAYTAGGLKVTSFPCAVRLKPGENGTYGILTNVSSGAYALIKRWEMSGVWHLPVTPTFTAPQTSLDGKYLQIGQIQTSKYSSGGDSGSDRGWMYNKTENPQDALLIIQNGVWDQKTAIINPAGGAISTRIQKGPYSVSSGLLSINGDQAPFSINGDQITSTNPEECTSNGATIPTITCTISTITWQKVSD